MKKQLIILGISILSFFTAMAQNVGINADGSAPDASAMLDIKDTKTGLLIPRVDISDLTTAAPVTSPATSLLVYNTNTTTGPGYFYWDGSHWVKLFDINDGKFWKLTGNAGTTAGTNFLGTTDNVRLDFRTNNAIRATISSDGNVGIGTTSPGHKLTIAGGGAIFGVDNQANFQAKNSGGTYESYLWPRWSDNIMYLNYGSGGFNIRNNSSVSTMFMTNSGNVGIGTTSPSQKLHVSGNLRVTGAYYDSNNSHGSSGQILSSTSSGTKWTKGQTIQSNSASVTSGNWYRIASNSGNRADASFTLRDFISGGGHSTLRFNAGVNYGDASGISFTLLSHSKYGSVTFTKVRIIENGTYDGAYLEVYCSRSGPVEYDMYDNFQNSGWTPVDWTAGSVPSGWTVHEYETDRLFAIGSNDDILSLTRAGRLGIGTPSPGGKLEINMGNNNNYFRVDQDNNIGLELRSGTTGGTPFIDFSNDASTDYDARIRLTGNDYLAIEGTNVGIGTTAPTQKLDVVGNVKFSGALMPNNDAGTSGKILLSGGAGSPPTWGQEMMNSSQTTGIGKYYSGAFDIPTGYSTLTLIDANCVTSSTCFITWVGNLPSGPDYGDVCVSIEAQAGQWVFHFANYTGYDLNNFQFSYVAFY